MNVVNTLREAGIEVQQVDESRAPGDAGPDAVIEIAAGNVAERFVVETKQRAPYPNELDQVMARLEARAESGHPMLVAPYVSESLGAQLADMGVSWADASGNFDLRTQNAILRQRLTNSPPKRRRGDLPQGSGSLGIIRALISFRYGEAEEPSASTLAAQAGVTQPRASQVLHQLLALDLVDKSDAGRWVPRQDTLLDRFLAEYRGPDGSEQFLYSLDPPAEVAVRAAKISNTDTSIAVSADVAPDLIVAWRRPTTVILYCTRDIDASQLGLVQAQGSQDANVILRVPRDTSVFPNPEMVAELHGIEIPLADVTQQIWDLQQLGGTDRLEAAGRLCQWLLTPR